MKPTYVTSLLLALAAFALPASVSANVDVIGTLNGSSTTSTGSGDSDSSTSSGSTSTATTATSSSTTTTTTVAAPTIATQPAPVTANAGATATFSVIASGSGTLQYQWLVNGRRIENATQATFTIQNVTADSAGEYSVVVSNTGGAVVSQPAALDVNVVAGTITTAPQNATVNAGATATFTITAAGTGLTYQWTRNGRPLQGETNATLSIANAGTLSGGNYGVTVSNSTGIAAVAEARLIVNADARLTNISARGHVGANDDQLIVGFVIRGQGSKKILMRAVGPTLATTFGVTDALATPQLTLHGRSEGQVVTDTNTSWGGSAALAAAFTQVGAFPLAATSADSALLETLDSGVFTANVTGVGSSTGVALAELYDADSGSPAAELVNISARARVGAEAANTLIAGFAITGTTSDTVLIRGVGPSLGTLFGLREALGASQVTLFDAKGNQIAVNTNWSANAKGDEDAEKESDVDEAADHVGAFRLPHGSQDSVIIATLAPGTYTAHVNGVNQQTGIALVEIYEVR